MAKSKFLSILTHRGSNKKSSSSKKGVTDTVLVPNESRMIKRPEELLELLNNLPEAESESDRELSFTYLVNSSPKKDHDGPGKGAQTEQKCDEATAVKEEDKMCRCTVSRNSFGSGQVGVLLNFHVPVPLKDTHRSRSVREIPCTTLAEIQKREVEFGKFGSWSALLRRNNMIPMNCH